jgi:hypothetical protein
MSWSPLFSNHLSTCWHVLLRCCCMLRHVLRRCWCSLFEMCCWCCARGGRWSAAVRGSDGALLLVQFSVGGLTLQALQLTPTLRTPHALWCRRASERTSSKQHLLPTVRAGSSMSSTTPLPRCRRVSLTPSSAPRSGKVRQMLSCISDSHHRGWRATNWNAANSEAMMPTVRQGCQQ